MSKTEKFMLCLTVFWVGFLLSVICGCRPATVYVDRPVTVKVMVPIPCPEPPQIARPVLKPLDPKATPQEVAEAALRAFLAVSGYADGLEVILESYRKPEEKK